MEIYYFKYLLFTLVCYNLSYLIGQVILSVFGDPGNDLESEFKKNLLGIWTIITVYSLFRTGFVSLSLGVLIILAFWLVYHRPTIKWKWQYYPAGHLLGICLVILFYSLLYLELYDPFTRTFYYYSIDLPVYASIVEKLNLVGVESITTDLFTKAPVREIYHYGDLWCSAFFAWVLQLNAMQTVYFVFTAISASVISIGAIALAQQVTGSRRISAYHVLASVCFVTLSGLSLYIDKSGYFSARWGDQFSLLELHKTYLVTQILILSAIILLRQDHKELVLVLLLSVIFNISSAPAILLALAIFILFLLLSKQMAFRTAFMISLPVLCVLAFLLIYGWAIGQVNAPYTDFSHFIFSSTAELSDPKFYKKILSTSFDTGVRVTISMLPFYFIAFIFRKDIMRDVAFWHTGLFVLVGLYAAVAAYGLFNFYTDGFQLWTVPNASLTALFIFLLFIKNGEKKAMKWLFLLTIMVCVYQSKVTNRMPEYSYKKFKYDEQFVKNVWSRIKDNRESNMACFYRPRQDELWGANPNNYYPYNFLKMFTANYNPFCLSVHNIEFSEDPMARKTQLGFLHTAPFYKYVEKQKKSGAYISIESSQASFINEAKIKYVFVEKGAAIPDDIRSVILETFTDPDNGYQFLVLSDHKIDHQRENLVK